MLPEERRTEIVRKVNQSHRVTVKELTEEFGASGPTIRRDLALLAEDQYIERFHGGALPISDTSNGSHARTRVQPPSGKRAIAARGQGTHRR